MGNFIDISAIRDGATPDKCEDYYYVSDNILLVVDGATGVCPDINIVATIQEQAEEYINNKSSAFQHENNIVNVYNKVANFKTDAEWFARQLTDILPPIIHKYMLRFNKYMTNETISIEEAINEALQEIENLYWNMVQLVDMAEQVKDASPSVLPSAGIVGAYIENDTLNVFQIGDCSIIIKKKDGTYFISDGDEMLHFLDESVKQLVIQLIKQTGKSFKEVREQEETMQALREIRTHMNSGLDDQYSIASFHNKDNISIMKFSFPLQEVKSLLMMTDGYYQLVDTFNVYSDEELHQAADEKGHKILIEKLRALQEDDAEVVKAMRLKKGDDATAVFASICGL